MRSHPKANSIIIICCIRHVPICCAAWAYRQKQPKLIGKRWFWSGMTVSDGSWNGGCGKCKGRGRKRVVSDDIRRRYVEEIGSAGRITSIALLEAFARVPREEFVGRGPWKVLS